MMRLIWPLFFILSFHAKACLENGGGFFPENDWHIPVESSFQGGLTKEEFDQVIDEVSDIYAPRIARRLGKLIVSRQWGNTLVNAFASRLGPIYSVTMTGGLARHPEITRDGFALVMCHEIGHHIGGAPKGGFMRGWSSVEGQSDYFASLKCLRELFKKDDNVALISSHKVPAIVKEACEDIYKIEEEAAVCQRIALAGQSVSDLFAALKKEGPARFETPSTQVVSETDRKHPHFQCRLDTFFQGALCDRPLEEKLSQRNPYKGICDVKNGDKLGLRPSCWFKSE